MAWYVSSGVSEFHLTWRIGNEYRGDIDRAVLDKLLLQMRIEKITSVEGWTKRKMVSLLKRAGLNEFYEVGVAQQQSAPFLAHAVPQHSHYFISVLSGKPVPFTITQETFDTLLQMFEKVGGRTVHIRTFADIIAGAS